MVLLWDGEAFFSASESDAEKLVTQGAAQRVRAMQAHQLRRRSDFQRYMTRELRAEEKPAEPIKRGRGRPPKVKAYDGD